MHRPSKYPPCPPCLTALRYMLVRDGLEGGGGGSSGVAGALWVKRFSLRGGTPTT
jgi:hypothetical protein